MAGPSGMAEVIVAETGSNSYRPRDDFVMKTGLVQRMRPLLGGMGSCSMRLVVYVPGKSKFPFTLTPGSPPFKQALIIWEHNKFREKR